VALDFAAVGRRTEPHPVSWDSTRVILYALGVGAGTDETLDELAFTTENSEGLAQQVLPTFPVILPFGAPRVPYGDVDPTQVVAAQQSVTLHRPFPLEGRGFLTFGIDGIYDKGSGALVLNSSVLTDEAGEIIAELGAGGFVRGAGGFGGDRGPATTWSLPQREPDVVVEQQIPPWQALLYRLSGDRNPLHSDPEFARRAGFARPILHGLCTYGFAGRAVLHAAAGSDPSRVHSLAARYSAPVMPGDVLRTQIWLHGDEVLFTTVNGDGATVLSHGTARVFPAGA
jgi:acyl dehydratase